MGHRRRSPGSQPLIRVASTSLGKGVFATRPIRRHMTIGEIRGTLVRDPVYSSEYCMDLGGGMALEPHAPFRYVNHCCDPNCEIYFFDGPEDDAERLFLQSVEDIEPGEQLTIDYGWSAEGAIPCACQSPLCRGWIVSEDDLPRLLELLANREQPSQSSDRLEAYPTQNGR